MMIATTALWIAIAAPPSDVCTQKATKVAVLDVVARDITKNQAELVSELLQKEIRSHGCSVIARSDIEAMLGLEKLKDTLNCDSTACLAEIGGALGVDEIVNGAVGKVGDIVVFTFKRIDPAHSVVVKQTVRQVDTAEDENFLAEVPFVAADLFGWPPPEHREVSAPKKKTTTPASKLMLTVDDSSDVYEVEVHQGFKTYRCNKAVSANSPCTLAIETGKATVVVKGAFEKEDEFVEGTTTYHLKYRKLWPWITTMVVGSVAGFAVTLSGVLNSAAPKYCQTASCNHIRDAWIYTGVAVAVASLVGGIIETAISGNGSKIEASNNTTAWLRSVQPSLAVALLPGEAFAGATWQF